MTDKEWLGEIKTWLNRGFDLTEEDINWLIKQSERVQELESEIENWQKGRFLAVSTFIKEIDLKKRVQELESNSYNAHLERLLDRRDQQIKRYRETLEFYANEINYLTFIENGKSNIEHDQGEKARQALEDEE